MTSESASPKTKRKGAKAYLVASGIAQACALVRYTLLARLLGPEQLGLAATLILTAQFFDAVSESGSDRFLVQDPQGDDSRLQSLVQAVFVGRGAFTAACLVLFAAPLAALYHTPALMQGFMLLGLSPLIAGFLHLDLRRDQREHDFRTEGLGLMASESFSLLATLAAAFLTRSFIAVAIGLIVRSFVLVLVSHLRARRPYRLGLSPEHSRRLAAFGWPLMINGILVFAGSQGDRVLVGNLLGVAQLGQYSAVLLLIYYPSQMLIRYISAMFLPQVARDRDHPLARHKPWDRLGSLVTALSVLMVSGFALVGPLATVVLYGHRFAQSTVIIALVGVLQTGRFFRQWPNIVALGLGRSRIPLAANIARLAGLPLAVVGARTIQGLPGICLGFTLGELLAVAVSQAMLNRSVGEPVWRGFMRQGVLLATFMTTVAWALALRAPSAPVLTILTAASLALGYWIVVSERQAMDGALRMARRLLNRVPSMQSPPAAARRRRWI